MRIFACFMLGVAGFMALYVAAPEAKEIFFGPNKGQEVQDSVDRSNERHEAMMEALKGMEKEVDGMGEAAREQINKMEEQDKLRAEMLKTQMEMRDLLAAILEQLKTSAPLAASMDAAAQAEAAASAGSRGNSTYRYEPKTPAAKQ